jgi:hypothetical protein
MFYGEIGRRFRFRPQTTVTPDPEKVNTVHRVLRAKGVSLPPSRPRLERADTPSPGVLMRLQVETVAKKSVRAQLADKISNLRSILASTPADWDFPAQKGVF